jgi:hypothetical protein
MISDWQALCKSQRIPCSHEFSLTSILGDQAGILRTLTNTSYYSLFYFGLFYWLNLI